MATDLIMWEGQKGTVFIGMCIGHGLCPEPTSQMEDSAVLCDPSLLSKGDPHPGCGSLLPIPSMLTQNQVQSRPQHQAPEFLSLSGDWGMGEGHGCLYIRHRSIVDDSFGKVVLQEEGDSQIVSQVSQINPVTSRKIDYNGNTLRTQSLKSKIHINAQARRRLFWNS